MDGFLQALQCASLFPCPLVLCPALTHGGLTLLQSPCCLAGRLSHYCCATFFAPSSSTSPFGSLPFPHYALPAVPYPATTPFPKQHILLRLCPYGPLATVPFIAPLPCPTTTPSTLPSALLMHPLLPVLPIYTTSLWCVLLFWMDRMGCLLLCL